MDDDLDKKNNNPLKKLWDVISSIGAIVGLSSLAENWVSDLIKWEGWIATVVDSYQRVVYPVGEWLLAWLPWAIPTWGLDYIVVGTIFVTSMSKGLSPEGDMSFRSMLSEITWPDILPIIIFYLVQLLLWPMLFLLIVRNYIFERASDFRDTLLWFASILLGFVLLLAINSAL